MSNATAMPGSPLHLPLVDAEQADAVRDELWLLEDEFPHLGDALRPMSSGFFDVSEVVGDVTLIADLIPVVEQCLDEGPTLPDPVLAARLLALLLAPGNAETAAVQIAFGEAAGWREVREMTRLASRAHRCGLSLDEYVLDLAQRKAVPQTPLTRSLHGLTRRRPDADRIRTGVAMMRRLAALAPDELRPAPLSIIGWLQWARGIRALGIAYLDEAQRIEPSSQVAYGLKWLVTTNSARWLHTEAHSDSTS